MKYIALTLSVLASLAAAQNAFTMTSFSGIAAGTPYNITWSPTTTDTVTIVLRQGSSSALKTVATIAASIANSGSYSWTPSPSLPAGSDYAFEIVSDSDPGQTNYSDQFSLASSEKGLSSASSASTSAPTASGNSSNSTASGLTASRYSNSTMTSTGSLSSASKSSTESVKTEVTSKITLPESGKTTEASKTTQSSGTATSASMSTSATGNAGVALKAGGALLGLVGAVVGVL